MKKYFGKNKKVPNSAIAKKDTFFRAKKSLGLKTDYSFVRAKKALGQNFLKSIPALNKIVEAGEIFTEDIILEIGPGKGALTKQLLANSCQLIAVEKDRELFDFLQNKFSEEIKNKKLILIKEDILKFDIQKMDCKFFSGPRVAPIKSEGLNQTSSKNFIPFLGNYKIIANIPYNITGAILKKFLTEKNQPSMMILMIQKEVAKRIIAKDGKESILSISVKAYGEPKIIMKVPAQYFSPAPKVDSAVIAIKNISRKNFNSPLEEYPLGGGRNASTPSRKRATPQEGKVNEKLFWEIVHAGFAHKRKKLSSNLKKYIGKASVDSLGNKRAEELTLKDWIDLVKMVQ